MGPGVPFLAAPGNRHGRSPRPVVADSEIFERFTATRTERSLSVNIGSEFRASLAAVKDGSLGSSANFSRRRRK
jgi:hypothetical protein